MYFLVACAVTITCYLLCQVTAGFPMIVQIIANLIISCIYANIVLFIIFHHSIYFKPMMDLINRITKNKFDRVIKKIG